MQRSPFVDQPAVQPVNKPANMPPINALIRSERHAATPVSIELVPGSLGDDVFNRLDRLNDIGSALSFEQNVDALLERILIAAKTITRADGGTIYLVEGEGADRRLAYAILRTSSLRIALGGTTGRAVPYAPLLMDQHLGSRQRTIASHVALTGKTVNLHDAYTAHQFDLQGIREFDRRHNYHSRSFLTVALRNHSDETIGVLQLINAIDPVTGDTGEFSRADQRLAESLASQAAVALSNRQLIGQLEHLFESLVLLIDEKSPYTAGHCARVPELTMMLAEAVDRTQDGPLADFCMTDADRYELRIAGLLHDCGKILTPVHVVDKATKLETIYDRIQLIDQRFEIVRRDAEIAALKARLGAASGDNVDAQLAETFAQIDSDRDFLRITNVGVERMADDDIARVQRIAVHYTWRGPNGDEQPFLNNEEIEALSIRSGTLTKSEREHINATIAMLEALPWPKHLKNVPEYAGGHHERMDGRGYPKGLRGDQMSVQARIMAIADIFEALTAPDRPYKHGKLLSETMSILARFAATGHIDPEIFTVFVREGVYREYAERFVDAAQIDAVDESTLLAALVPVTAQR